jgi:catechol 2,3-dioxygenase-like lactoylglutathione lyase family enzyme
VLKDRNSSAIVAVRDIERARKFYEDTLGLTRLPGSGASEGVVGFRTGKTMLTVYESEFAGTNQANAVTWEMQGDLVETVKALKAKGVGFEHYDLPGVTLNGDIHEIDEVRLVWLKDPDGNILHLTEGI